MPLVTDKTADETPEQFLDRVKDRIVEIREAKGLTQLRASELLRIAKNNYQRFELRDQDLKLMTLFRIAKAFGVTVTDLVSPEPWQPETPLTTTKKARKPKSRL